MVDFSAQASLRREDAALGMLAGTDDVVLLNLAQHLRPGDLVRARVVGVDDTQRYTVSIAEPCMGRLNQPKDTP